MALNNLLSVTFTQAELTQIDDALTAIENVLQGKTIHLTPEQRQTYGRIAEQNKLFVNKAKGYMEQYPQYVPNFIDKAEFDRDYTTRGQLETRFQRLSSVNEQLSDTKILLDHDNYHNSITFYRNITYLLHQDMQQFFINPTTGTITEPTNKTDENKDENQN